MDQEKIQIQINDYLFFYSKVLSIIIILIILYKFIFFLLPKDEFRNFDINTRRIIREKTFNRCEFGHINRCKSNIDEIDHFFPFSKGGASTLQNAVGSCKYHNRRKGAYFPVLIYFIIKHRRKKYYKNGSVHLGQFCFSENFKKREKERDV